MDLGPSSTRSVTVFTGCKSSLRPKLQMPTLKRRQEVTRRIWGRGAHRIRGARGTGLPEESSQRPANTFHPGLPSSPAQGPESCESPVAKPSSLICPQTRWGSRTRGTQSPSYTWQGGEGFLKRDRRAFFGRAVGQQEFLSLQRSFELDSEPN